MTKYYITSRKDGTPVSGALVVPRKPRTGHFSRVNVGTPTLIQVQLVDSTGAEVDTLTEAINNGTLPAAVKLEYVHRIGSIPTGEDVEYVASQSYSFEGGGFNYRTMSASDLKVTLSAILAPVAEVLIQDDKVYLRHYMFSVPYREDIDKQPVLTFYDL